jgi:hypothetical protein
MKLDADHTPYTEEELKNIFGFIGVLSSIHDQLISENIDVDALLQKPGKLTT